MADLALATAVRCRLIGLKPDIEVAARDGIVEVQTWGYPFHEELLRREIEVLAGSIEGVTEVHVVVEAAPLYE